MGMGRRGVSQGRAGQWETDRRPQAGHDSRAHVVDERRHRVTRAAARLVLDLAILVQGFGDHKCGVRPATVEAGGVHDVHDLLRQREGIHKAPHTRMKPLKGIRRLADGHWRAYGRCHGQYFSKRFPAETELQALKDWRRHTRVTLRATQRGLPPSQDWKRLKPSHDGWCYIYFVRAGQCLKIGRATDVGERVRALQTAHHEELSLVLSIPAHAALEGAIHARFAHLKARGEWFRIEDDLVAFIQAVQSGANPIALLW